MRTTVRETLFPMLCWTPTASVKWYSMDEYQLSMRHNSLP